MTKARLASSGARSLNVDARRGDRDRARAKRVAVPDVMGYQVKLSTMRELLVHV